MPRPLLGFDTETTGHDLHHGCKPFYVSACDENLDVTYWQWAVNPLTRIPVIPAGDKKEIKAFFRGKRLVGHNSKFDVRALRTIGIDILDLVGGWENIDDTILSSHVLQSGGPHGLKEQALLKLDIPDTDEAALKVATNDCRKVAKKLGWDVARAEHPHFPASRRAPKDGWWVMDTWLPREVARHERLPASDSYWSVLHNYGSLDPRRTFLLWELHRDGLDEEGRWDQYRLRHKMLRLTYDMESRGIPVNLRRLTSLRKDFAGRADEHAKVCRRIVGTMDGATEGRQSLRSKVINLGSSKQLQEVLYKDLKLPIIQRTKTGIATDKDTLNALLNNVPEHSRAGQFLTNLVGYKKSLKADDYLLGYQLAGMPVVEGSYLPIHYFLLHCSFNITGTATTRFSSSNPNAQNVGRKKGYNLRHAFGPLPGRWWLSLDQSNIEMRIFAYRSGEKALIKAFEEGRSAHLIIAEVLYPELLRKLGEDAFKETDEYSYIKNGNFSLIYGAGQAKADATYHVAGAYKLIRKRFKQIDRFMHEMYDLAVQDGGVTTLGGYFLQVGTSGPHKAVNYFVQGSAGIFTAEGMVNCDEVLQKWNAHEAAYVRGINRQSGKHAVYSPATMIMQVHDELDFDVPASDHSLKLAPLLQKAMEAPGPKYGIPFPVECKIVKEGWDAGETYRLAI